MLAKTTESLSKGCPPQKFSVQGQGQANFAANFFHQVLIIAFCVFLEEESWISLTMSLNPMLLIWPTGRSLPEEADLVWDTGSCLGNPSEPEKSSDDSDNQLSPVSFHSWGDCGSMGCIATSWALSWAMAAAGTTICVNY